MNYLRIYNSICERARTRKFSGYGERHHVVPRCMGGSDSSENLVKLSPEEHYVCHQLLVKIYPDNLKIVQAACAMSMTRDGGPIRNNKLFGWLRKRKSELQKGKIPANWNQVLENNKGRTFSEDRCRKISEKAKGRPPHNKKTWDQMTDNAKKRAFVKGDSRVPVDWQPPPKPKRKTSKKFTRKGKPWSDERKLNASKQVTGRKLEIINGKRVWVYPDKPPKE